MAYSLNIPSVFVRACPCPSIPRSDRTGQGTHIARQSSVGALFANSVANPRKKAENSTNLCAARCVLMVRGLRGKTCFARPWTHPAALPNREESESHVLQLRISMMYPVWTRLTGFTG